MELTLGPVTSSSSSSESEMTLGETEPGPDHGFQSPEGDYQPQEEYSSENSNRNIQEMIGGSLQGLLRTLRCHSCFHYLTRPIRQCISGHFYCEQCFMRISACLKCRGGKSTIRCYLPEAFTDHITFPCRHAKYGCDFFAMGAELKNHMNDCRYTPIRCPISSEMRCKWNGPLHDVQVHCGMCHPNRYFNTSYQKFRLNYFSYQYTGYHRYAMVFNTYGKLFSCALEINYKYMNVKWYVALLTHHDEAKNYSFEIKYYNKANMFNHITIKSPCDKVDNVVHNFSRQFTLSYDLLQDFCDDDGSLHYSIEIHNEARNYGNYLLGSLLGGTRNSRDNFD